MENRKENFENWLSTLYTSLNSAKQFKACIPKIEELVCSIIDTGSLPNDLVSFQDLFIKKLRKEIIFRILNLTNVDEESKDKIHDFFKLIFKLGNYGISILDEKIIMCAYSIIGTSTFPIYKFIPYKSIIQLCVDCDLYDSSYDAIKKGVNSLKLLDVLFNICSDISIYIQDFNKDEFAEITSNNVLDIVKQQPRSPTSTILDIYNSLSLNFDFEIPQSFCFTWLSIWVLFAQSDIFEKQQTGFKEIIGMLGNEETLDSTVNFFRETDGLKIFSLQTIHPDLSPQISKSLSILARHDLISNELLLNLWNLHSFQHSDDLRNFFKIFSSVAFTLPSDKINDFVDMCLNPTDKTEQWFSFLGDLCESLGKREDAKESFYKVRDCLFNFCFENNNDKKLQEIVEGILPKIINLHLDDEKFEEILNNLANSKSIFLIKLITPTFKDHKIPIDKVNFYLIEAIDLLTNTLNDDNNVKIILSFITHLCYYNHFEIPNEQVKKLFYSFKSNPNFVPSLTPLISKSLISIDYLEELLINLQKEEVDQNVFRLCKIIVYFENKMEVEKVLKSLPFKRENLLWHMIELDTNYTNEFSQFLSSVYSLNDGIVLTDYTMMTTFIQKCIQKLQISKNKKSIILLLKSFINEIERLIDIDSFNIKRHSSKKHENIHVDILGRNLPSELSFDLPENMTISALMNRISTISMIPLNSFVLYKNKVLLDIKKTIKEVANKTKAIKLTLMSSNINNKYNHIRECIPSILISRSPLMDQLIDLLKEGYEEVKELLDYLPTISKTLIQLNQINFRKTYDYNLLLPREYPEVFLYNFEAIYTHFTEEFRLNFDKTGGFTYLIESSNIIQLEPKIIQFIDKGMTEEMKLKYSKLIFINIIPILTKLSDLNEENDFISTILFLTSLSKLFNEPELPNNMINILEQLLFHQNKNIRKLSSKFFSTIKIPFDYFLELLPKYEQNKEISKYYFISMIPHIDKYSEELLQIIKQESSIENSALLEILSKMLELNMITKEDQIYFTNSLIDRYLNIDSREKKKNCFDSAIKCLTYLQNKILLIHLSKIHNNRMPYDEWNIDGDSIIISPTGKSGLENLGATCFLNSTLQQFYAIPILRNTILEYDGDSEEILELQNLFAHMYLKNGQVASPELLVEKFVGWDGEPINPYEQQDACEFLEVILDKFENSLQKGFIQSLFRGTMINHIEGITEKFSTENTQPFYTFTLPIQGINYYKEAFDKIQKPDFLTGKNQYHSEELKKNIDAKKFISLGNLPPYLIIQLSRFNYNYETFRKVKVNSIFEFPIDLDLIDYTSNKNQETKYKLSGIIMHIGNADFGHYTSFIKDRESKTEKWYLYNDNDVTEVKLNDIFNMIYGKKSKSASAYILFYDRIDTLNNNLNIKKPKIPDNLIDEINEESNMKDEYRLFCSSSYSKFMNNLAESKNNLFVCISLSYYFDTYPFTNYVKKAKEFSNKLINKIVENPQILQFLIKYLTNGSFEYSLIYSPELDLRNGSLQIIELIDCNLLPIEFIKRLFNSIKTIISYYQVFDQTFTLISYILKNSTKYLQYANQYNLSYIISKLICIDIPNYIESKNSDKFEEKFYNRITFNGLFDLLYVIKIPQKFQQYFIDNEFILHYLKSRTTIFSYINLIKTFENQSEVSLKLLEYSQNYGIFSPPFKLISVLFNYFRENAFDIIPNINLMIGERSFNDFDLCCAICVMIKHTPLRQLILENYSKWLFNMLTNDILNCRIAAEYAIAFLVQNEIFSNLPKFPEHELIKTFGSLELEYKEVDEMIKSISSVILIYLIDKIPNLIEKITKIKEVNDYNHAIGVQMIEVIDKLNVIVKIPNINEIYINFMNELIKIANDFDYHVMQLIISMFRIQMNLSNELIVKIFPKELKPLGNVVSRSIRFFEILEPLLITFNPSDEFILSFLDYYIFTSNQIIILQYNIFAKYLWNFTSKKPDLIYNYVKDNLYDCANTFLSAVLIILECVNKKLPILDYLWTAVNKKQYFSLGTLIEKTFLYNENTSNVKNISQIISLLNSPGITKTGRENIWNLVYEYKPKFDEFKKVYNYKGDWLYLTKYLLIEKTMDSIELLIESAQNDLNAFELSFEFLCENCQNMLFSQNFAYSIINQEINGKYNIVIKYLNKYMEVVKDNKEIIEIVQRKVLTNINIMKDIMLEFEGNSEFDKYCNEIIDVLEVVKSCNIPKKPFEDELKGLCEMCENELKSEVKNDRMNGLFLLIKEVLTK